MAAADPVKVQVRVVEVVRETADAHSFVLEPLAPGALTYRPGQFLTVRVPSDRRDVPARCYSLSSSPLCGEAPTITVKRTPGGYVSNWLCDNVAEGTVLDVLRPAGTFTPASLDADLVLVAAGSGITPVLSILKACLHGGSGRPVLLYANRDERSVIFRDALRAFAAEFPDRLTVLHWLESVQGLPSDAGLRALLTPYAGREAFVCGPDPFMACASAALTGPGLPAGRVHVEKFASLTGDPFEAAAAEPADEPADEVGAGPSTDLEVTLDGDVHRLEWPPTRPLLDVLLDAGLPAPYSCREGSCSACACVVLEGEVKMRRNDVLDTEDLAGGVVLGCQALPLTTRLRVSYDE